MEVSKERRKRNLIVKAWQRWVTWASRKQGEKGCFSVYVGEERKRFKVKTELVNHPQFKKLLDDAEMEYGFVSDGPIWLPCSVELFFKVMAEIMDAKEEEEEESTVSGRGFSKGYYSSSFALCSPSRLLFNLNTCHDHQDGDEPRCAYQLLAGDPHSSK